MPVLLGGCSYFDTSGHEQLQVSKNIEDVQPYESEMADIQSAVRSSTGGSVEIFSLDDVPSDVPDGPLKFEHNATDVRPVESFPSGQTEDAALSLNPPSEEWSKAGDPSVQIFSLDGLGGGYVPAAPMPLSPAVPPPEVVKPSPALQPAREDDYVEIGGAGAPKTVVYFGHDSSVIGPDGQRKLDALANAFNPASVQGLTVEGHASVRANYQDEEQRKIVNLKISMDRAFAVAAALIQRGISNEAIRVIGWGDTRPPAELNGKTAEDAARRVEISG